MIAVIEEHRAICGVEPICLVRCPGGGNRFNSRHLPDAHGEWNSVFRRYRRWVETGVFEAMLERLAELTTLHRPTDCRRRCGAAVLNLDHGASVHSCEKIAPSNPGIKQLAGFPASANLIRRAFSRQKPASAPKLPDGHPVSPSSSTHLRHGGAGCRRHDGWAFGATASAAFRSVGVPGRRGGVPAATASTALARTMLWVLSWIAANDVARSVSSLVYTQMLNRRGDIECDLTVARLAEDRFYIVTGTGFATHDFGWISRNVPPGLDAHLVDVTSAYGVLSLMGPGARRVLEKLATDDVSNEGFPFGQVRRLSVAGAPVLALRVTYVGELGWELHVPTEFTASVYEALMDAGREHGIRNAGYRAIESLRLEKGCRAWGADIGPDSTPLEAGLSWAVKLRRNVPFLGRERLEEQRGGTLRKLLCTFTADDPDTILLGRETIFRDGKRVGWLSSGGFGHTVSKPIGLGYVRREEGVDEDFLRSGSFELDVATRRVSCTLHLQPLFDPTMARVRA